MSRKEQYPGGVKLTAKTARTLAMQEFGTARGLTKSTSFVGVYFMEFGNLRTHTFKKPFEYAGETYTTLTFDFEKMTGRDMVSIETEMQMNNEYCLAPEVSRSFQAKMAAKAAGIGSDVLDAMPIKDFNRITNAARSFLIDTGY